MSTTPESSKDGSQQPSVFDTVAQQYTDIIWIVYLAVGAALALTTVILIWKLGTEELAWIIFVGLLSAVLLGLRLYMWARLAGAFSGPTDAYKSDAFNTDVFRALSPGDSLRLTTLATGALVGFAGFVLGVLLIFKNQALFVTQIEKMRENVGTIVLCTLPI